MSDAHQEFDVFSQAKKLTEGEARACIEVIANRFAVIEAVNSTLKAERDEQFRAASQLADGVVRISAERDALRVQLAAAREDFLDLNEYWNGGNGSAVDACQHTCDVTEAALNRLAQVKP